MDRPQPAGDRRTGGSDPDRRTEIPFSACLRFAPRRARAARDPAISSGPTRIGCVRRPISTVPRSARRGDDQADLATALSAASRTQCVDFGVFKAGIPQPRTAGSKIFRLHDLALSRQKVLPGRRFRERVDYPRLKAQAIALAKIHNPTAILVEDAGHGRGLAQELERIGLPQSP